MAKNLVIVESPAKAKTIEKILGKDFTVKSSFGHIRDLPGKDISIDIDNGFEPNYVIPSDKKKVVTELKKLAKQDRSLAEVKKVTLITKSPYGLGQVQLQSGNVYSHPKRVHGTVEKYFKKQADTYYEVTLNNPNLRRSNNLVLHLKGEHKIKSVILHWENIPH